MLVVGLLVVVACSSGDGAAGPGQSTTTTGAAVSSARLVERPDWGAVFEDAGIVGTFVLRAVGSDETHVWDAGRADERRLPASTFKILNSMIILETGVLDDVDEIVPWDGVERDVEVWNRDHSLRTGIEVSAVWMYQQLAREVGEDRMREWVARSSYGNADAGGGIDRFWLSGSLRISPLEQLDVLEEMLTGGLPFRAEVVDAVREILIREQGEGWAWSHKTGTALAEERALGWLVGTTESEDGAWVFAMNIDLEAIGGLEGQVDPLVRQHIARRILRSEGALP
ncbi:MAG: penicillin-binding transpeptidase domain-containing protein [Ilumatobacter sp.]|uniref:penicillin-binding transpeptidase domain-containing protein n=1 Tax=Ilumatobacter sp. TaxID=1967498 RepID=UPI002632A4A9|nr:penicillin-binding transpeptidase domain-containing protein [Ilumatobacter sp.]MDJ0767221.1 penicillin-binding transpeptidase domain-containing protein [Ilumatobacter sp.]